MMHLSNLKRVQPKEDSKRYEALHAVRIFTL